MTITYAWRGGFDNSAVNKLHAEGFHYVAQDVDWLAQVERHSLGWVCARLHGDLVGFVNVAWNGGAHAFILDTVVAGSHRRSGIGAELVAVAAREARLAGCEWLHVDFEDGLREFYLDACGFTSTTAGLIALSAEPSGTGAGASSSQLYEGDLDTRDRDRARSCLAGGVDE